MHKVLVLLLVFTAVLIPLNGSHPASAATRSQTLLWLGGLYADTAAAQLDHFAAYHVNGFNLDHVWKSGGATDTGYHDDFLNGGIGRLPSDQRSAYSQQVKTLAQGAATRHISQIFLRLNAQVYAPSHPAGQAYTLDPCDSTQVAQVQQTMTNEAQLVLATGVRGLWMDAEPYNNAKFWYAEQQAGTQCSGLNYTQAALKYYALGKTVAHALLTVDPGMQILISPGIGVSYYRTSQYAHFPDFYAGMLAVASQTPGAQGIVSATEVAYSWTNTSWFPLMASYEMGVGTWSNHTSGLQQILQAYDQGFGTTTWQWHLQHDSDALGTWPLGNTGAWNYSQASFPAVVTAQRAASPAYTWIRDENGQWFKPTAAGTCVLGTQTYQGDQTCAGWMLGKLLPVL
jgi:hypothetical protein